MKADPSYLTAKEISEAIHGELIGDPSIEIKSLSAIDVNEPLTVTFWSDSRYNQHLYPNTPRTLLVPHSFDIEANGSITYIRVADVYEAWSKVSHLMSESEVPSDRGISMQSYVSEKADLMNHVSIGHYSVIEAGVRIGERTSIGNQVSIGRDVRIGNECKIHDGVRILSGSVIGDRCTIKENAVIGGEGFGFAPTQSGYQRIVHQGIVIIEDDVVVGSNTCIDRGALKDTLIRKGVKLDNLIQIGHGAEIGAHVAIAAQTGISGSSVIGENSLIGGQVGVIGHIKIAPGSKIQGQSGVAGSIEEPNQKWYGYPAIPYYKYLRSFAVFKRLPELLDRIKRLENK